MLHYHRPDPWTFYEKEMVDTKMNFGIQEAIDREKDIEKIERQIWESNNL